MTNETKRHEAGAVLLLRMLADSNEKDVGLIEDWCRAESKAHEDAARPGVAATRTLIAKARAYLASPEASAVVSDLRAVRDALRAMDAIHFMQHTIDTEDWGLYEDHAIPEVRAAYEQCLAALATLSKYVPEDA